jgi:hypothetical protein
MYLDATSGQKTVVVFVHEPGGGVTAARFVEVVARGLVSNGSLSASTTATTRRRIRPYPGA